MDNVYRVGIDGDPSGIINAGKKSEAALKGVDDQAKETGQTVKKGFHEGSSAAGMMNSALSTLNSSFGAMQIGQKVLEAINLCMDQATAAIRKAADESTALESSLREIAAMKGRLGQTGTEALANLKTRAQTLQSSEEVRAFQETMVGSGASSVGNLISQGDFDKLGIQAGKFQAAEGGNASTHGQLAGMIPALMGRKTNDKEAFAKIQQLYNILQPGGASYSSGINQLLKVSPLTTSGVYKDIADQTALLSAFSLNNREGAGENVQQFTRATVGGLGKLKGTPIEGDSQKIGEYLKGVGATDQMDPIQIGKLISSDITAQQKSAAGQGKKLNIMDYLRHQGYSNQEDVLSLMSFHGLQSTGQYKVFEDLANPKNAAGNGEAQAAIDAFQATNPVAQARKADAADAMAKFSTGAGPMQYYQSLQKMSFNKAKADPDSGVYGELDDWKDDWKFGGRTKLQNLMSKNLYDEAERVGVDVSADKGQVRVGSESDQAKKYFDIAQKIAGKGGEILPGMDTLVKNSEEQLRVQQQMRDAFTGNKALPNDPLGGFGPAPLNGPRQPWNPRP